MAPRSAAVTQRAALPFDHDNKTTEPLATDRRFSQGWYSCATRAKLGSRIQWSMRLTFC
jgi:hypothetical protein